jgi:hypothetical protein
MSTEIKQNISTSNHAGSHSSKELSYPPRMGFGAGSVFKIKLSGELSSAKLPESPEARLKNALDLLKDFV